MLRDISYNTLASVFLTREPFEVCDLCPLSSSLKVSEVTHRCASCELTRDGDHNDGDLDGDFFEKNSVSEHCRLKSTPGEADHSRWSLLRHRAVTMRIDCPRLLPKKCANRAILTFAPGPEHG